jgi:hypothetical protein
MLALKNKIDSLNTTSEEVERIKNNYMNIIKEKNIQITRLIEKTLELESEIKKRDLIIEENNEIIRQQHSQITDQENQIKYQNDLLDKSLKHVFIYSRKKAIHYLTKANTIRINDKLKNIKLISEHPLNSYILESTSKKTSKLTIRNTKIFWQKSNYIIIKVRKI